MNAKSDGEVEVLSPRGEDSAKGHTLILGIGNLLMGDEGVGVHAIRKLEQVALPPGVELLDGGTGTFYLLDAMQRAGRVILMDATLDGNPPGTVSRLTPRYSSEYPRSLTAHDVGLKDLIDAFYLTGIAPEVVLYTVSVNTLEGDLTMDLSPVVERSLSELCTRVLSELEAKEV